MFSFIDIFLRKDISNFFYGKITNVVGLHKDYSVQRVSIRFLAFVFLFVTSPELRAKTYEPFIGKTHGWYFNLNRGTSVIGLTHSLHCTS